MRLHRLTIRNFRSHESSSLDLGDMNVLAGPGGAGKTSCCDAICAALTGRTRLTDRRGAGIREQIRRGQPKAEIEVVCAFGTDQPVTIKRTITESSQSLEVPFGGKNLSARQALLTDKLGGVDEIPDVLLDPRLFPDRPVDEQKQTLLKLLRPPVIEVPKAAQAVGIQSLASVQQVDDQIKSLKEGTVRSLNAVIKNLEETCPAEPSPEDLEAARSAEQAAADADVTVQALTREVAHAEHRLEDARRGVVELESAKATAAQLPELQTQLEVAKKTLESAVEEYKRVYGELEEKSGAVAIANVPVAEKKRQIAEFEELPDECPTCCRKISARVREEILSEMRDSLARLEKTLQEAVAAKQPLVEAITVVSESGKSARAAHGNVADLLREAERAQALISGETPDLDALSAALIDLQADLSAATVKKNETAAAANAGRDTVRQSEEYARASRDLQSNRTKREAYLAAVESLVALKDSILGGESAQKLELDTSAIFERFFPGTHVILSPSGASVAPGPSTEGTPVAHLSSGQKVIFDMGLRVAAAKATGFNLLATDDANKLAPKAREAMLRVLRESGCQVIMCTTADNIGPIEGCTVYSLSNPGVWGPTKVTKI